jgi:hypothetical protein
MFKYYKILGEFGPDYEGVPNLIQSWVPMEFPTDLDPAKKHYNSVWRVSLIGKRVELRPGDRVVVLRPKDS